MGIATSLTLLAMTFFFCKLYDKSEFICLFHQYSLFIKKDFEKTFSITVKYCKLLKNVFQGGVPIGGT